MAAPVVKWVGGKTRLLPELRARLPAAINRYYEPFAGGAALFFSLFPAGLGAVLNDANPHLINLYRCLAQGHDDLAGVIDVLSWCETSHSATHYKRMRNLFNAVPDRLTEAERAGLFVYLNKTCFNGLWRVNKSGSFNVPMGDYANPNICDAGALRAAGKVLAGAELRCGDYRDAVSDATTGDFLYFDPPYVPLTETSSFTSYTAEGFGHLQQLQLAELFTELVGRGCLVMLSNSDTPVVRELYAGHRIDTVRCGRGINSDGAKRGAVNEVIITGGF